MGIYRKDYIIYGYKLSMINDVDLWDDKYLPLIEGHQNEEFTIIVDSMCGEYCVFGIIISADNDGDTGWDFVKLDFQNLDPEKIKVKYKELFNTSISEEPYLFIFSDFS